MIDGDIGVDGGLPSKRRKLDNGTGYPEDEDEYDNEDDFSDEEEYNYKPKQSKGGVIKGNTYDKYMDDEDGGLVQSDDQL